MGISLRICGTAARIDDGADATQDHIGKRTVLRGRSGLD